MDDEKLVWKISEEAMDEVSEILAKYGKDMFDSADPDIPFEDAVRLESLLWNYDEMEARFYVSMARGLLDMENYRY